MVCVGSLFDVLVKNNYFKTKHDFLFYTGVGSLRELHFLFNVLVKINIKTNHTYLVLYRCAFIERHYVSI